MRFNLLLSVLLFLATTLSALHELEHISQEDDSVCMVYHVNDKLSSVDIVDVTKCAECFLFEKITYVNKVRKLHFRDKSNPDRAPPLLS